MEKEKINVSDSKLQSMLSSVWTTAESPLYATSIEFKYTSKNSYSSGFLLVTYGAVYFYKAKVFGSPEFFRKIHLLDCREFKVSSDSIVMVFDEYEMNIKSKETKIIAQSILEMFYECTYGVKDVLFMQIQSSIDLNIPTLTERPKDLLKHRSLFLAHFYGLQGDQLHTIDYFDRFEEKQSKTLVLGPHFHPGNFAAAFGHAIGWETSLDTVVFQSFAATKFPKLLDTLLQNTQTINRVAFTDYKESRLPQFEIKHVDQTNVTRYWFMRTCGRIIIDFLENASGIPEPMQEFVVASCTLRPQEFGEIVTGISLAEPATDLRNMYLVRLNVKPFPFDDITRLISFTHKLETITVRGLDTDATHLLRAICATESRIRSISLTHMQFRSDISRSIRLPTTLLMINVSFCAFSSTSFKTLIELLTMRRAQTPYIFQAQALVMKPIAYNALAELDFDNCAPNLCEVDWSANHVPKEPMRYFFAFLFTQKRMHLLIMNEVSSGDSTQFLSYLAQLVTTLPLFGIDLSGKFPNSVFTQFIASLAAAPFLRRLKLRCKNAGDNGLNALATLLPQLQNLTEVVADGFKPRTPQPFFDLWKTIAIHPAIHTCDIPNEDLSVLGLSTARMSEDMQRVFNVLEKKPRPSSIKQRLEYMINQTRLETGEIRPVDTVDPWTEDQTRGDIFLATSTMVWTEHSEDEQIDRMTGTIDARIPEIE